MAPGENECGTPGLDCLVTKPVKPGVGIAREGRGSSRATQRGKGDDRGQNRASRKFCCVMEHTSFTPLQNTCKVSNSTPLPPTHTKKQNQVSDTPASPCPQAVGRRPLLRCRPAGLWSALAPRYFSGSLALIGLCHPGALAPSQAAPPHAQLPHAVSGPPEVWLCSSHDETLELGLRQPCLRSGNQTNPFPEFAPVSARCCMLHVMLCKVHLCIF